MKAVTWAGNRVLVAAAWIVETWCAALASADRRRHNRRTKALHGPAIAWPQRGTCQGGQCTVAVFTEPEGDIRGVLWCEKHCPDCRTTPDGTTVPCLLHDYVFAAEMKRRLAQ